MPINKVQFISLATEMNAILRDEDKYKDLITAWNNPDKNLREAAINHFIETYGVSQSLEQVLNRTKYPRPGPTWMVASKITPDGLMVDISSFEDIYRDP